MDNLFGVIESAIEPMSILPKWLRLAILALIVLGITFRFTNLDTKVYWRDEAATSRYILGYTIQEVKHEVYTGQAINIEVLKKFQHKFSDKGIGGTVSLLAIEDPQHPPLYYLLTRFWAHIFGNSPLSLRSFSAFLSLLTFPLFYWLSVELFELPKVGFVSMGLVSVSLFHLFYAQEARPYALWINIILASSAILLRALKSQSQNCWLAYILLTTLGLYTSPLMCLVIIGHGLYCLMISNFKLTRIFKTYLLSTLVIFVFFSPWIAVVIGNANSENTAASWLLNRVPFSVLFRHWMLNISYIFVSAKPRVFIPVIFLVAYSLYFLCSHTKRNLYLFVVLLIASSSVPLILVDLVAGGVITVLNRYLIPAYIGIQLSVAYLLSSHIIPLPTDTSNSSAKNQSIKIIFWRVTSFLLVLLGIWTCSRFVRAENAWNKGDFENLPISRIVNTSEDPLIISDESIHPILSLSHYINSEASFYILSGEDEITNLPKINKLQYTDYFVFKPSKKLLTALQEDSIQMKKEYPGLYRAWP